MELVAPHSDRPEAKTNVIRPAYNEANLLERIEANLQGSADATQFVKNIDYDAKGQRVLIEYGNGAVTTYDYDPETFRLTDLVTRRDAVAFPDDCPDPPPADSPGCQLQSLHYTYDPAGNIIHIRDDAQQTIFFSQRRVEPSNDYTYDSVYRLIEARGREHLGQAGVPEPHSHNDQPRVGLVWSANDSHAMGTYLERYIYDAVGNIMAMRHRGCDPSHPGWTRKYAYEEASQIEPSRDSNRLSSTTVEGSNPPVIPYLHDVHGNMVRMPHLANHPDADDANMHWDYKDQLRKVDLAGIGGTAYYVYDGSGQRIRKMVEKSPGLTEERIYLGGFEVFRRHDGSGEVTLERETLHVVDGERRIALVDTRTHGTEEHIPEQLIRYQLGNHLGSASLELDGEAQIISYEEYYPYGSTSYQAGRSRAEVSLKRYRYTGKERDEETDFSYHGARYYAPWVGRWSASDSSGLKDGPNLYMYCRDNPIIFRDLAGREVTTIPGVANREDDPETIRGKAKDAGYGFRRPPIWSEERGMWNFGENNLYKLTTQFDPGPAEIIPTGDYSTKPQSGQDYDPFAPKAPPGSGKKGGDNGSGRSPGEPGSEGGGSPGGKRTSGPPGGSDTGSIYGTPGGASSGAPGGSGDGEGGGGGEESWLPDFLAKALLVITVAVAAATLVTFLAAFSAAISAGASIGTATTIATGEVIIGAGATGAGAGILRSQSGGAGAWRNLPGGVRIRAFGSYWIKETNPDASRFARWWGRGSLNAQARALDKLGDMAPSHIYTKGRLITSDAGPYMPGNFWRTWWEGTKRLGTPFNDIRPRNIGSHGLIFDPAKHPIQQGLEAGTLGVGLLGGGLYIYDQVSE